MKFCQALSFTETSQLVPLARVCEDVGFEMAFVSDHLFVPEKLRSRYPYSEDGKPPFGPETEFPEAWAAISAMATATRRLRFTTAIYVAPLRHPLEVAKSVATAAALSGGRVALGAGAGWLEEEFAQLSQEFRSRGRRLDEMIEILRAVWAGGMVEHHGRYYDFERLQMSPTPPGPVPIYIGGASAAALRRAARNDGWIGTGNDPTELPAIAGELARLRREAGRAGEPFEVLAALTAPPDLDLFRRLEDAGVTAVVNYPLAFSIGPGAPLSRKRAALEQFGNEIIAKL